MGPDHHHCNATHHEEVAVVFTGENGEPPQHRDMIVYPKDQLLRHISYMLANCDPMVYPLVFLRGEPGWHNELNHVEAYKTPKHNKVTML